MNTYLHLASAVFFLCGKQCVGAAGSLIKGLMWVNFFNQIQWFILFKHFLKETFLTKNRPTNIQLQWS